MSFFEQLAREVAGNVGGGDQHAGMAQAVMGMLNSEGSGGLAGLAQSFEQQGLGHLISAWAGNGPNPAATADQMHQVFGSEKIGQLAEQLGIPPQEAASTLAAVLPTLIDKLTPNGQIPGTQAGGALGALESAGLGLLKERGLLG